MDLDRKMETWTGTLGAIAPADGNAARAATRVVAPASLPADSGDELDSPRGQDASANYARLDLGPNNERLEALKPKLVHALRELVRQYREEGAVARRHEIRRIRQA